MSSMTLKALVSRMNGSGRQALEQAVGLCVQHTHETVEIEHLLRALREVQDPDLESILPRYGLDPVVLDDQLRQALDAFRRGSGATPSLSPRLVELLRQCWLDSSLEFGEPAIRGATLLFTLLNDPAMAALGTRYAQELEKLDPQRLLSDWAELKSATLSEAPAAPPLAGTQSDHLARFTVDLTAEAEQGRVDPVIGRDDEVRQMIDILTRRRQNNPILTGEAGVGKTAVVEGLAQRIVNGQVPDALSRARIHCLDLALLQAGAGVKGEFENRLKGVIREVRDAPYPVLLFIDEAHNMIGAGGQSGQGDAANLLKPALARGELRMIAATTWAEYKKFFDKDAALSRRFQVVVVDEPDTDTAIQILRGLVSTLENHHDVSITDGAVTAAVTLSTRYLSGRQLPDKAVALLDTCCARVAMSQASVPSDVESARARVGALQSEIQMLERESRLGTDHGQRLDELTSALHDARHRAEQLESRWQDERDRVQRIRALQTQLDAGEGSLSELNEHRSQWPQQATPMVHWQVDEQLVAEVLSDWTGIPLGRMQADAVDSVLSLDERLRERVKGQDACIDEIAATLRVARANLADEKKPLGVFFLVGPSGVGKTETALAVAEQIYGSEDSLITINMSEFKEEHKVSQLVGSPPGYVGFGEGGLLTEAVRRRPYSVVLLDEMEKAHPGVQELFYQVFDKGMLRDGEGRDVDFRHTVILMTSNAGTELISDLCADPMTLPEPEALRASVHEALLTQFKPAFLGRTTLLPYRPLDEAQLTAITRLQLDRVIDRVRRHHQAEVHFDEAAVTQIVNRCRDASSGARNIQQILQKDLLPELSRQVLEAMADDRAIQQVTLGVRDDAFDLAVESA